MRRPLCLFVLFALIMGSVPVLAHNGPTGIFELEFEPPVDELETEFAYARKEDNPPSVKPVLFYSKNPVFVVNGVKVDTLAHAKTIQLMQELDEIASGERAAQELAAEEAAFRFVAEQESQRCVICPEYPDPPSDPNAPNGFCTGLRDEYTYLDNSWFGGVAEAYNYCLSAGTRTSACSRPCSPDEGQPRAPGDACVVLGFFTISYQWSPFFGECVLSCTRCN